MHLAQLQSVKDPIDRLPFLGGGEIVIQTEIKQNAVILAAQLFCFEDTGDPGGDIGFVGLFTGFDHGCLGS